MTFIFSSLLPFLGGLSFIVAIHELGHLCMAKWCGMRVNRYMVFFPPVLFQRRWRDTIYGIGSIPLGGFVEIEGMGKASEIATETLPEGDFRTKSAWQKSLVMGGGILFNLISGYSIIVGLLLAIGNPYLSKATLNLHGITPTVQGEKVGFVKGDKVIAVNGKDFKGTHELYQAINGEGELTYTLMRRDEKLVLHISEEDRQALKAEGDPLFSPLMPQKIQHIVGGSIAAKAGLKSGDKIISINGQLTPYVQDLKQALTTHPGGIARIVYKRGTEQKRIEVMLPQGEKLGITLDKTLPFNYKSYGLGEAIVKGGKQVFDMVSRQIKGFAKIFRREVSFHESIQSPVAIFDMFRRSQGIEGFLWLVALLSIILALMNLLPFPALDGFHLLINLCEGISGKKVPTHWYMKIQAIGAILLGILSFTLIGKDLYKLLR